MLQGLRAVSSLQYRGVIYTHTTYIRGWDVSGSEEVPAMKEITGATNGVTMDNHSFDQQQ